MLSTRFPFSWEEQPPLSAHSPVPTSDMSYDDRAATRGADAGAARFRDGSFGEIWAVSIDSHDSNTAQPASDATGSSISTATRFTNMSAVWKQQIHAMEQQCDQLDTKCCMAEEVQRCLTVMLVEALRNEMQVHPAKAARDACTPVWQLCAEKLCGNGKVR